MRNISKHLLSNSFIVNVGHVAVWRYFVLIGILSSAIIHEKVHKAINMDFLSSPAFNIFNTTES